MNASATIALENPSGQFRPFDEVRGTVNWQFDTPPKSFEIRLFWFTRGSGGTDAGVVEVKSLDLNTFGKQAFSFTLPGSPYSFSGNLITLQWALELIAKPSRQLVLKEITCAPTGVALVLPVVTPEKSPWWKKNRNRY